MALAETPTAPGSARAIDAAPPPAPAPTRGEWRGLEPMLLAAALLVAAALRVWLLARASWLQEGDDALSTLMALEILRGHRPIMLDAQTYAAAWEPYAMALAFAVFGPSRVTARLPVLLASLALVVVTWALARATAGPLAGRLALPLAAVPGAFMAATLAKPWAPYTETMVFGGLCLLAALRLAFPPASPRTRALAAACGVAGGLAFWMHPIAVYYLAAAGLLVLARVRGPRLVEATAAGMAGFLIGALPVWLYNLGTGGATLRFVAGGSGGGQSVDRADVLGVWWNADLPRVLGLWNPWGPNHPLVQALLAGLLVLAVAWTALAQRPLPPRWRPLDAPLLLLAVIPLVYVLSGFGGPALNPWGFDASSRYALHVWLPVTVVLSAFLAALWRYRRWLGGGLAALVVLVHLGQSATTNAVLAFQTPYWSKLPADSAPLLRLLADEGVTGVWMNHWAGKPLMFDAQVAGQPLVAYDWYDVRQGGIDRFPHHRALVEQAPRPAFVLVTDEAEPELEQRLRGLGVTYVARRVPPYVVIIPESRRVHPSEVEPALDYRY